MLSKAKERSAMSHNVSYDNEAQRKNIHAAWQPLDRLPKAARKGEPRGRERVATSQMVLVIIKDGISR